MENKTNTRLLTFSIIFSALWFFGNLYEEIVLVPNQIINAYYKLQLWRLFFTEINQIYYYVPFTQLAVVVICILYFRADDKEEKASLKRAAIFGLSGIFLTAIIISQLNLKLFLGDNLEKYKDQLQLLSIIWMIGNAIRLYLVGNALRYSIKAYMRRALASNRSTQRMS